MSTASASNPRIEGPANLETHGSASYRLTEEGQAFLDFITKNELEMEEKRA